MAAMLVRIALTALAVAFAGWLGYVVYLGLVSFFGAGRDQRNRTRAEDKSN